MLLEQGAEGWDVTVQSGLRSWILKDEAGRRRCLGSHGEHCRPACYGCLNCCLSKGRDDRSAPSLRQKADEVCPFLTPSSTYFHCQNDEAATGTSNKFCSAGDPGCRPCGRGTPELVKGETMVVSTASWVPLCRGSPCAMTSIRRLSCLLVRGTLRSDTKTCVATRAPASRHTRAVARSNGPARLRKAPCSHLYLEPTQNHMGVSPACVSRN